MKKFFAVLFLIPILQCSFGQLSSLNMTLHARWDPDTLPTAGSREYNDIWGYVDCAGNEYAIIGSASMIHFFDVTDRDTIVELGYFPGGQVTTWRDMKTFRDRAYAVSDNTSEGLMIFDLSNIQDTIIKSYHDTEFFSRSHNIYIDVENGRLYAAGTNTQNSGLVVLDIATDPDNPQLLASVSLPGGGYVHDVFVQNNIAYCSHGYNGFYIWDFTIPTTPVQIAGIETGGYNHSSWISQDGSFSIYAEEVPLGMPLGVIDLTDAGSGNIEVVNTFKYPLLAPDHVNNVPHNPFIRGDYLIVSYYHDGVQIFDISDPLNPERVAYYDTHENDAYSGYQGCWGVYPFFPSGTIIASDINEGLHVLTADSLEFAPIIPVITPDATISGNIPSPFCEGQNALLSAPPGYENYQWFQNGEPVGPSQNFLFVSNSGSYYAEISNGHCYAVSDTFDFEVTPAPDLSGVPTGNFEICENEIFLITAPDTLDQYVWLKNGNVFQQGGHTLQISETGNYSLIAYLGDCSTNSGIISVVVNAVPDALLLNEDFGFCEGDSLTLEANEGANLYTWFLNNSEIAQTSNANLTVFEAGTYHVLVEQDNCENESSPEEVTVFELPDIQLSFTDLIGTVVANEVNMCFGSTFLLSVPAASGTQYEWFKDGLSFGNSNSIVVSEAGDYYATAVNEDDCSNTSDVVVVNISQPVAWIEFDGTTLSSQQSWASYQWYLDGDIIEGASDATYDPTITGEYHLEIVDEFGCESVSNYLLVTITGVKNIPGLEYLSVFPNPVTDILSLELKTAENMNFDIQIVNVNSQVLYVKSIETFGVATLSIDFGDFAQGVYFIRILSNDHQLVRRVVKI